ncbi:hypothetical protein LMG29542_02168 [Paraburkholderia humisilvae]|uniref:Uncharacterized protein n=1 Tax=Paraburkholderia humisilvae TaxID=627669 RepID=A0A6J5DKS7_9BURK|nr:hypothetical protein LMG29542_02168 [Paraburkholderia humisilvae]
MKSTETVTFHVQLRGMDGMNLIDVHRENPR